MLTPQPSSRRGETIRPYARPLYSPTGRAYRLCVACGLTGDEIDRLIDTKRHAGQTREQQLDLFYATFEARADAEPCEPCAEVVLDAAGAYYGR